MSLNRFSTTNVNDFASSVESYLAPTDVRPETRIEFTSSIDSELSTDTFIAADTAPVTDAATAVGAEDAVSISITLTGGDIDGTVTSYSLSTLPANGTLYTNVGLTNAAATGAIVKS